MNIRIHEEVWASGSDLQRTEWRTLLVDLIDEGTLFPGEALLADSEVSLGPSHVSVVSLRVTRTLWSPELEGHAREYLRVIRQLMEESPHSSRFEALDMGKKVVHDQAARTLRELAPDVCDTHETYRRLFSLLVALRNDTTKLPTAHGHHGRR
jgi:hypothetical protein